MRLALRCLPFVLALAACGGKTIALPTVPEAPDSGPIQGPNPPPGPSPPGTTCVTLPALTPADLACQSTSDCTFTSQGTVCADQCDCGTVAANNAAAARIASQLPEFTVGCGCGTDLQLECVQGVCYAVGPSFDAGPPPGFDGGPSPITIDAGPVPTLDASTCVDIDVTTYDTTCSTDEDCVALPTGQICSGECDCGGGSAVNVDNTASWQAATSGIVWGECECPAGLPPVCAQGQCVSGSFPGSGSGS
jgi:hypothetical protein